MGHAVHNVTVILYPDVLYRFVTFNRTHTVYQNIEHNFAPTLKVVDIRSLINKLCTLTFADEYFGKYFNKHMKHNSKCLVVKETKNVTISEIVLGK